MSKCTLIHGDCLEEMDKLIMGWQKVDLILTDPPYGTTQCKWDNVIPFEEMWACINELSYETTPTLLFGAEPFSTTLRCSNFNNFRYDWIWDKERGTNFLNANRTPLPCHEIISVFYKKLPYYNPQKMYVGIKNKKPVYRTENNNTYGEIKECPPYVDDGYRFPLSIIHLNKYKTEANVSEGVHPTQKPIELLEYLIKTYTKENDTVLDFTMGSGSTGVACLQTGRNFIGIELEEKYYNIAKKRCSEYQSKLW